MGMLVRDWHERIERSLQGTQPDARRCLNCSLVRVVGLNPKGIPQMDCAGGRWPNPYLVPVVISGKSRGTKNAKACADWAPA